jgi:hypothetical protein
MTKYQGDEEDYEEDEERIQNEIFDDKNEDFIEFKENVKNWLLLDDDISTLQKAIKDRRTQKNIITPKIIDFMNKYEINDLNTKNGKIKCSKSFQTKPLNKDYLISKLGDYFRDFNKGEKVTQFLFTDRPKEEKLKLKRVNINTKKEFNI